MIQKHLFSQARDGLSPLLSLEPFFISRWCAERDGVSHRHFSQPFPLRCIGERLFNKSAETYA